MTEQRRPLFEGLPPLGRVDRDVAAMLPYAELLRDLVDRRLYPQPGTALVPPSDDALFDESLRIVLERMLADRLAALTPEQFAAAYRSVHGDPAFAEALEQLADLRRADLARDIRRARMEQEARVSGRLRLDEFEPGESLTVALFDPRRPELAARRFAENAEVRPLHRMLQVRLTAPAAGEVELTADNWTGPVWAEQLRTPTVEPFTRGRLGTGADAGAAEITVHAPVTFVPGDAPPVRPPQIVGYVETLDGALLLDGLVSRDGRGG